MNIKILILLLCCTAFIKPVKANTLFESFDKAAFYQVLKNGSADAINKEISLVNASFLKEKNAYEGALCTRKCQWKTAAQSGWQQGGRIG